MSGNLIRAVVEKIWTYPLHMRVSTLQCICNEANRSMCMCCTDGLCVHCKYDVEITEKHMHG